MSYRIFNLTIPHKSKLLRMLIFLSVVTMITGNTVANNDPAIGLQTVDIADDADSVNTLPQSSTLAYPIVDTAQIICYNNISEISCPTEGQGFYGQDAQYISHQPDYMDNGDGTITDINTGLMWVQDAGEKAFYYDHIEASRSFEFAGYHDWRIPTIKELYSLMDFTGIDNAMSPNPKPFIDDTIFVFEYGDQSAGDRPIDSQWMTSSVYVDTVMGGQECFFGVNFADGRIKCYPTRFGGNNGYFLRYVRGNQYGENEFIDNGDGTITDVAAGLMWQQADSAVGMDWANALAYCQDLELADYDDWYLPNAKELQSIVDYTRSPDTTNSAAIAPLFVSSEIVNENGDPDYSFYWTSTTHVDMRGAMNAVYISFGRSMGYFHQQWMDVHGAGSQRSDPKSGNPEEYPTYRGPQGDAVRVFNYARCTRETVSADDVSSSD